MTLGRGTPVEKEGTRGATRKIPVTVVLDKEKAGAGLQDVPVAVQFTQVKAKNVVQVPVSALLAQPGGGFAVEITAGGRRQAGSREARRLRQRVGSGAVGSN